MTKHQITRDDFEITIHGLDVYASINYTFNRQSYPGDYFEESTHEDSNQTVEITDLTAFDPETGEEVEITLTDNVAKAIKEKVIEELTEEAEEV